MKNILIITENLRYVCGVSSHIKILVNESNRYSNDINYIILCGDVEDDDLAKEYKCKIIINDKILHKNRAYYNFLKSILLIKSIIKNYKIDIIHSHNHYAANLSYYAKKLTNLTTIQSNHGIMTKIGRLAHFKSDYHIVLSERIKSYLILEENIKSENIFVIKQGLYNDRSEKNKTFKDKLIFLSSSRFVQEKRLDLYIKAANSLNKKFINICDFYISGDGEEENNLKYLNKSFGGKVKFINPRDEYREIISKANVFVFTTSRDSEGVPIVIIEALINDCLVISSSYRGYTDIFPEKYSNLIFNKDDVNNLIKKMEFAIDNYASLMETYKPLFKETKENFSVREMIQDHVNLYKNLILR